MRFVEFRQSQTSPVKYRLELSPKEVEKVKHLIMEIITGLKEDEKRHEDHK
jgi:hypothetical protein